MKTTVKKETIPDPDMTIGGGDKSVGLSTTPFFDEPEVTEGGEGKEEIKFVKANVGEILMDRKKSASFAKFMQVYNEHANNLRKGSVGEEFEL